MARLVTVSLATPGPAARGVSVRSLGARIVLLCIGLVGANLAVWTWVLVTFHAYPMLLGTALLAYGFGLRHAVDADHIAAIDNVTRTLMQSGQRPVGVGLFFSLGHSTIVAAASIAIAATATAFRSRLELLHDLGGTIGTLVSSVFLLTIASMNIAILLSVRRSFLRLCRGESLEADQLDQLLSGGGMLARLFRPLFARIGRSWQMYPLGMLFGLGFDTATEVGLLGISAAEASHGLPIWSILAFPVLFTVGMSLVDSIDSVLMLGVYGWAFVKPVRKLYYNMVITLVSVVVAVLIGGIEALGLLGQQLALHGLFWSLVTALNNNFGLIGYCVIAFFVMVWIAAALFYRARGFDRMETELPAG